MTVATPMTAMPATIALMSPIAQPVTSSIISSLTDSDTSLTGSDTSSDSSLSGDVETIITKIAPIVTVYQSNSSNKRPQMKYDPEVPLTKEETSAWRREQRRKRNRESAAACRKRQRDRISELEVQVADWKAKFNEAVRKLGEAEGVDGAMVHLGDIKAKFPEKNRCMSPNNMMDGIKTVISSRVSNDCNMVTPTGSSSNYIPATSVGDIDFPVLQEPIKTESAFIETDSFKSRVEKGQHLSEMITRPAASRLYLFRRRQLRSCFGYVPTQ